MYLVTYSFRSNGRHSSGRITFHNTLTKKSIPEFLLDLITHEDGDYVIINSWEITEEDYEKLNGRIG